MSRLDWILGSILLAFFAVGAAGHVIPDTRPLLFGLAPAALLLTAGVVLVPIAVERNLGAGLWAAGAAVLGFGLEVAGVATGAVFGAYTYGPVLGPRLLGVPPIIGLNWALVVLGAVSFTTRFLRNRLAAAAVAGAITAGFDWVLEPFAVSAGYWTWTLGSVPVRNYIAWFLAATALACLFTWKRLSMKSPVASVALLVQLAFFAVLRTAGV